MSLKRISECSITGLKKKKFRTKPRDSYVRPLETVDDDIKRIEEEIERQKERFQCVREQMLSGIVSHESIVAKKATDNLLEILSRLKTEREVLQESKEKNDTMDTVNQFVKPVEIITEEKPSNICNDGDYKTASQPCYRIGGYKPLVHQQELVAQFQGKRRATAPRDIVDLIAGMCDKYKIDKHTVTPQIVRKFLKQMQQKQTALFKYNPSIKHRVRIKKFTDYYKHTPEIAFRISGVPPPYMTPMQEERIFNLFPMIIEAYKSSPRYFQRKKNTKIRKKRNEPNNPNYYYIYYKECEMLGFVEFLPFIPLPKNVNNIRDNDENFWKHTCQLYGWSYTPTK